MAIRLESESIKAEDRQLKREAGVYSALTGGVGIPLLHWLGEASSKKDKFLAMAIDLLGSNLENLFNCSGYHGFPLKTILYLAIQLISRMETIHNRSFIHGDIKPENFLLGLDRLQSQVFVVGFGLAKKYPNPTGQSYVPSHKDPRTACYASINSHDGIEQSYRDDMESLGYVLVHFCRGSLPWQELRDSDLVEKKKTTSVEDLCHELPGEFATYLHHVRSLRLDEKPNYSYLREIFKDLFSSEGFNDDHVLEWTYGAEDQFVDIGYEPNNIDADLNRARTAISTDERTCVTNYCEQSQSGKPFTDKECRYLTMLHLNVLRVYHNFSVASQHPSAPEYWVNVLEKENMLDGMWNIAIYFCLELLRTRKQDSPMHRLHFISRAYCLIASLLETVPKYENIWIERLGDLARYCAAVKGNDNSEAWAGTARYWYNKAADKNPGIGRIQHRLAMMESDVFQQLFHYTKSLVSIEPYLEARETMASLFDSLLQTEEDNNDGLFLTMFVRAHGYLFHGRDDFIALAKGPLSKLDGHINAPGSTFQIQGPQIMSCNFAVIFDLSHRLLPLSRSRSKAWNEQFASEYWSSLNSIQQKVSLASSFASHCLSAILDWAGDDNVFPAIYFSLAFIEGLAVYYCDIMRNIEEAVPWERLTLFLNSLLKRPENEKSNRGKFLGTLPEDFLICGQAWSQPAFQNLSGLIEPPSHTQERVFRCLQLGRKIASASHTSFQP